MLKKLLPRDRYGKKKKIFATGTWSMKMRIDVSHIFPDDKAQWSLSRLQVGAFRKGI